MKFEDLNLLDVGNTIQISGAVYSSGDKHFVCLFPTEDISLPLEHLEMDSPDWEKFIRQTDIMETEVLSKSSGGKLAKTILRKSTRQIEQGISWRVFYRDGFRCRYCNLTGIPLTVDHLVLWEEGGPSVEDNLVASCRGCNKKRGRMQYGDWLKNPYYLKVSQNLDSETRLKNSDLLKTLDKIPKRFHTRGR